MQYVVYYSSLYFCIFIKIKIKFILQLKQLFTCFYEEGCVAAGSLWEKTLRYILLWTIKYFLWWFLWDMKAAPLQKNTHPALAGYVVFSSMIDTFITRMNIKFIHVKWSTWSSFKVPSSWLRFIFIYLFIYRLPNSAKRNYNTYFQEVE